VSHRPKPGGSLINDGIQETSLVHQRLRGRRDMPQPGSGASFGGGLLTLQPLES